MSTLALWGLIDTLLVFGSVYPFIVFLGLCARIIFWGLRARIILGFLAVVPRLVILDIAVRCGRYIINPCLCLPV